MCELIGKSGKDIYIMSKSSKEACKFNSYGECVGRVELSIALLSSKYTEPVDVVSIIGEPGLNMCELYYNSSVSVIRHDYFSVYNALKDVSLMLSILPLRVVYEGNAIQLLIPFRKGSISREYIENRISGLIWENLSKN